MLALDEVVKLLEKGNSFYAFNFGVPEPREGMFFNKRILQENGYDPDLPYDMQKDGTWTWETFEELCKKLTRDTDNDGVNDALEIKFQCRILAQAVEQ